MRWILFTALPVQLICVGIVARLMVFAVLCLRGLAWRYPGLGLFLLGGAAHASYILWSAFHSRTGYYDAYNETTWVPLVLWGLLALEIFVSLAKHFPISGGTAFILLAAISIGGGVAWWALEPGIWQGPVGAHLDRAWVFLLGAAVAITVSGVVFAFLADFAFKENVKAYAFIGVGLLLAQLYAHGRARQAGRSDRVVELSTAGGSAVAALLWCRRMRRDGENFTMPPANPQELLQALGGLKEIENEVKDARGELGGSPPRR